MHFEHIRQKTARQHNFVVAFCRKKFKTVKLLSSDYKDVMLSVLVVVRIQSLIIRAQS